MDPERLFLVITQAGSFIAAFAAIAAGIIMASVTKKFGTGILAHGFKAISIGVLFIAAGIIIDTVNSYLVISDNPTISAGILLLKEVFFVAGTYIIVIGSKNTGDKLEMLSK